MTYMASCGDTPCDQYNGSDAKWFKIDQYGKKPDGSTWYQADISCKDTSLRQNESRTDRLAASRDAYDVTLPQNLAPGGYLIRHEVKHSALLCLG